MENVEAAREETRERAASGKGTPGGRSEAGRVYLKIIIPVSACVLLAVAGAVLVFALQVSTCTFDATTCKSPCPLGYKPDDDRGCPNSCECAVEGIVQGDVAFRSDDVTKMLQDYGEVSNKDFSLFFGWKWTIWDNLEVDGRFQVPYVLDEKLTPDLVGEFEKTIKNMSSLTCFDFIERSTERDYLNIIWGSSGCSSLIGRATGKQDMTLPNGCFYEATIQHEMFHAFGIDHEQTRPDRDGYVDIFLDNIMPSGRHNFQKLTLDSVKDLGSEYELMSGMHYQSYDFALNRLKPALKGKGGEILDRTPKETFLTEEDIREVNLLYDCRLPEPPRSGLWTEWQPWSDCTATCDPGKRTRFKDCIHEPTGEKLHDGCGNGTDHESEECTLVECVKPGIFGSWLSWSPCSSTCGSGLVARGRNCEVDPCDGPYYEFQDCFEISCDTLKPIGVELFGEWSDWDSWRRCDVTCGEGKRMRYRECKKGNDKLSTDKCKALAIDGITASDHQEQSITCGIGSTCTSLITLAPTNLMPVWGWGTAAAGHWGHLATYTVPTTPKTPDPWKTPAPTGPGFSEWGEWGKLTFCDVSCGIGRRMRVRNCLGDLCSGEHTSEVSCEEGPCPGEGLFTSTTGFCSNVCIYGEIVIGRFDEDEAEDIICVFPDGYVRVYSSDMSTKHYIHDYVFWEGEAEVCAFVGKEIGDESLKIFAADITGDGKDDLICVNDATQEIEVTFNGDKGFSERIDWRGQRGTCDQEVFVKDMDGDGKSDLLCGDKLDPYKELYPARDPFTWPAWGPNLAPPPPIDHKEMDYDFDNVWGLTQLSYTTTDGGAPWGTNELDLAGYPTSQHPSLDRPWGI